MGRSRSIDRASRASDSSVANAANPVAGADEPTDEAARRIGAKRELEPVVVPLAGEVAGVHVLGDIVGEAVGAPTDEPATEGMRHDRAEPDMGPLVYVRSQTP